MWKSPNIIGGDDFLDLINIVERIFDYENVDNKAKVKLIAMKLIGRASTWWE